MNEKKEIESRLLEVKNLRTSFYTREGEVKAVDGVSFSVYRGKTLGIVGESGCGKTVVSLSIMNLISRPFSQIVGGQIFYHGRDLLTLNSKQMRAIRGNKISMIFQESMSALNPVFTIGNQICETIALRQDLSKKEIKNQAIERLKMVGIPSAEKRMQDYPHHLSGGMRQRVMIAMALSCNPEILIADEPTTALDATIQAQILNLLKNIQEKTGLGLILITHDLAVVAEMADEVLVMYAGQVVEQASTIEIFQNPKMPYTKGLLRSIPVLGAGSFQKGLRPRLEAIAGMVPNVLELPIGCRFQERCQYKVPLCEKEDVALRMVPSFSPHSIRCVRDLSYD